MKIFSEKINYGLLALFELAKTSYKEHVTINSIATAHNLKKTYLEKVLLQLKRANLVESIRGAQGGYKLKKLSSKIKVIDIIKALEGPISIIDYKKNSEILRIYWMKIEEKFNTLFNTTLEDLINQEQILHGKLSFQI
ncbi:MAG: RrF2 family transcriptional regulator [Candidatus Thorarchaeota archaeon]